jgi:hypothetical protein
MCRLRHRANIKRPGKFFEGIRQRPTRPMHEW